jgi:hypothetical protein
VVGPSADTRVGDGLAVRWPSEGEVVSGMLTGTVRLGLSRLGMQLVTIDEISAGETDDDVR